MRTLTALALLAAFTLTTSTAFGQGSSAGRPPIKPRFTRSVSDLTSGQLRAVKKATNWRGMRVQGLEITKMAKRTAQGERLFLVERHNRQDRGTEPAKLVSIKDSKATLLSSAQAKYRGLRTENLAARWANKTMRREMGARQGTFSGITKEGFGLYRDLIGYQFNSQTDRNEKVFVPVSGSGKPLYHIDR